MEKLQEEEYEEMNMLHLMSLGCEIPRKRVGYIYLELSKKIWAGDTYLVVINIKMGIKPSRGVDKIA